MSCYDIIGPTYSPQTFVATLFPNLPVGLTGWGADNIFTNYTDALTGGATCVNTKITYDNDVGAGQAYIGAGYIKPGDSLARPSFGSITVTPPVTPTLDNTQYGFSVLVSEFIQNGTQSLTEVDRGALHICWAIDGPVGCTTDPNNPAFNVPQANYVLHIDDNLTGTFPIVIGPSNTLGATGSFSISFHSYIGPHAGFTGSKTCTPSGPASTVSYSGTTYVGPVSGASLSVVADSLTGFTDTPDGWCCLSSGFNCCGAGLPPGPHFLIPRPDPGSLMPGQSNSSTPPAQQLMFLSNYTFQFVNNFGRVGK